MIGKEFIKTTIESIVFEDKQTSETEFFGIYRIPTQSGCLEIVKLYPNIPYAPHIHDFCSAEFVFLEGQGYVIIGEDKIPFEKGTTCFVPAGVIHGFEITDATIFLSVQSNPIQDRSTGEIDIRYE